MFATKTNTFIIGWVAIVLGYIMNVIFMGQAAIGIQNIGLCIIIFTFVIYMLMTPMTYKQQKFSRMSAKMQPELQAVQKKYAGKKDQVSMQRMQEETQAVYAKYGVNPMGSCLQLAIQMPILFALYRVIWNIPAYVGQVKEVFTPLVNELTKASGASEYLAETAKTLGVKFPEMTDLTTVDVLYKFKPANWDALAQKFPDLKSTITGVQSEVDSMNHFVKLNIADSPMNIIKDAFADKAWLILVLALMIPILAGLTQWLNTKLMTAAQTQPGGDENNTMANSMKTMNNVMPLMSVFFCLTLPVGIGLYWIAGAVIRQIQMMIINKRLEKENIDDLMNENIEKMKKKREKKGYSAEKVIANANLSTKNVDTIASKAKLQNTASADVEDPFTVKSGKTFASGSIASKANMVNDYNEKHQKR